MTNSISSRELVRSLVEIRFKVLNEDQWQFGTIGDKPKGAGTNISSRIGSFVNSDSAKGAIHSAASKVFSTVQHHHKAAIAGAVTMALSHVAHIDMPGDLEEHVHHQLEHLGTSLSISKTMAHQSMMHAVSKLKELRGIKEAVERDDELDAALIRLHKILKKLEPRYKEEPSKDQSSRDQTKVPPPPKK